MLLALAVATILSGFEQGSNLAAFVENCPIDVRYSGLGFAYNLGNSLFGGTAPLVISFIVATTNPIAPAYYLIICGLVSLPAILTLVPKKSAVNLGFFSR